LLPAVGIDLLKQKSIRAGLAFMKLIHIIENLDKGAVENWLVNVFLESRKTRPDWEWTFFCILGQPGRLDKKVLEAGGEIIYAPMSVSDKLGFLRFLRKTLRHKSYDIIHAHHDFLSGFYMLATVGMPARKLIQVHNNDEGIPVGNESLRKILLPIFRKLAFWLADDILAISENTRDEFRKGYRHKKPLFRVLYYGIHMDKFDIPVNPLTFRRANILPDNSKILLYTGRMIQEKNPVFVVDVLKHLRSLRDDVFAVFVGTGDKMKEVTDRAEEMGLKDRVRLIGWSDDIPGIMKSADVLVFPRKEFPKEGLGLVVVESQCAGLPVFTTQGIVKDAIILDELFFSLDLTSPEIWAKAIHDLLEKGAPIKKEKALERMLLSKFEIKRATANLISVYEEVKN
jgi:glycosyltransferase involved in cell wall biosynthesis